MINRDCRCPGCGTCEAAATIDPLKKERRTLRKSVKEEKQRYDELYRMHETYIKKLHAAEEENKRLREAHGPSIDFVMDDLPSLVFRLSIVDREGGHLHREVFHGLQVLKEFLIGGFDGILPLESNDEGD